MTKSHGGLLVLDSVSTTVGPRTRLGIVGPNGVGKTTFLRILAGLDWPDAGRVMATPPDLAVGYLAPGDDLLRHETVSSYLARRTGVAAAEAKLERVAAALGAGRAAEDAYAAALRCYLALSGPDLEVRAAQVCSELGLPADRLELPMASLSGGQRARAALAAILLARFEVLLLDEPTNDLDFAGLERLEARARVVRQWASSGARRGQEASHRQ